MAASTSFEVSRVNTTTFLIIEHDIYGERPYIYAKVHPNEDLVIISDTGCNAPAEEFKNAEVTELRQLLETYPVKDNDDKPINPGGEFRYLVILSHCHYDHIGGITQFMHGNNEILASAAGRDFIESDIGAHSLSTHMKLPVPYFKITHWAQSYERLTWPLPKRLPGDDAALASTQNTTQASAPELGITILHTPGHCPDELAWVDHVENTIYVGDSFYQLGSIAQPIIFPPQGNLMDWGESVNRIESFMWWINRPGAASDDTDGWIQVQKPPKLSAGHQTCNVDLQDFMWKLRMFFMDVVDGRRKILYSGQRYGELFLYYMSAVDGSVEEALSLWLPARLLLDPQRFVHVLSNGSEWTRSRMAARIIDESSPQQSAESADWSKMMQSRVQ